MTFKFPLVRFSTKEYLEELQNGAMYLRNACHYRTMDGNAIQGDIFELKIPYPSGKAFKKALANNKFGDIDGYLSLTRANTFICCMYAYNGSNVVKSGENWIALKIKHDPDKLKDFGDYALVICGVDRFIQSFDMAEISCRIRLHDYVDYRDLNNKEVANAISENLISYITAKDSSKPMEHFEFIKDLKYKYQQEYRFIVHTDCSPEDSLNEYRGIIKTDGIKINIEDSKSYSFICPTEDLLNRILCCKWENDKYEAGFVTFKENTVSIPKV